MKCLLKLLYKMVDIIANHNARFLGRNSKLLRIRQLTTTTTTTETPTTTTTTTQLITPVKYGLLYNNYAPTDARGIAPAGWHVPTQTEWYDMLTYIGGASTAGTKLKETGSVYWLAAGGTNEYGFNARGAGDRGVGGGFGSLRSVGYFQTSSNWGGIYCRQFSMQSSLVSVNDPSRARFEGASIRLIKDNSTNTGTMTDYDGNIYPTVTIGTQVWMAANLIVEHYNNGDAIPEVTDGTTWAGLTSGGLCAYNNDWNNV